jgi:hypothetical protein
MDAIMAMRVNEDDGWTWRWGTKPAVRVTLTPESTRGALPVVGGEGVLEADATRGVNLQLNTMT